MLKTLSELVAEARENLSIITAKEAAVKAAQLSGLVIDVREPAEYAKQSAPGVINIPRGMLEPQMLEKYPDENLAIFIHCASGARATFAAEQLQRVGYKRVWVITCKADEVYNSFT